MSLLSKMQASYDASNAFLITPHHVEVTVHVIWDDGENIHYVTGNEPTKVKQTTKERFEEITSTAHYRRGMMWNSRSKHWS